MLLLELYFYGSVGLGSIQLLLKIMKSFIMLFLILLFALFGSTVGAFVTSGLLNNGKLSMISIINATLSGGVAVGTACMICHKPGWASLLGFLTGGISAFGFEKITPFLEEKIGL